MKKGDSHQCPSKSGERNTGDGPSANRADVGIIQGGCGTGLTLEALESEWIARQSVGYGEMPAVEPLLNHPDQITTKE